MAFTSVKKIVVGFLCQPAVGRLLAFAFRDRISCQGCVIDTSSDIVTPKVKAMLFWRIYESAEIRFVRQYLNRDLDVIELGSSLGVVTCQIRKRMSGSHRLVSIEAHPELARQVKSNLRINGLDKKVSVINKAIAYHPSQRKTAFYVFSGSNLTGHIAERQNGARGLKVEATTLSQIIDENGISAYALVSDIEGAEAGFIIHDQEALKKCRQIIIELHDTSINGVAIGTKQMCDRLTGEHGFTLRDQYGPIYVFER